MKVSGFGCGLGVMRGGMGWGGDYGGEWPGLRWVHGCSLLHSGRSRCGCAMPERACAMPDPVAAVGKGEGRGLWWVGKEDRGGEESLPSAPLRD
jgi:hypothetical protein